MTASNLLSFSRILLIAPTLYLLSFDTPVHNAMALIVALIAAATDYFDGKLARKYNTITTLGRYLDPVADKLFIAPLALYLAFVRGNLPAWFAVLIVAKDALIMIGSLVLLSRKIIVQADPPGKYTVFVVALVFVFFILDLNTLGQWAIGLATLFILHSTYFYYLKFLALVEKSSNTFYRAILPAFILILSISLGIRIYFF